MESTRLDSPTLYEWDLNENSTRYDYPRSWPEADVLRIQFAVLATINALVAFASFILIVAILKSRKVRKDPFNLYLLLIAIPDFVASSSCFLTCVMSAPASKFFSEAMCGFQAFYLTFAFAGNAWMNAVIVYQIHKLLKYSHHRRRYFPPTRQQVRCHAAAVYTYAFTWGLLAAFHIPGFPLKSKLYYGVACFPMEYDTKSAYIFYLVFIPCILLLPCLYTMGVIVDILWNRLLPAAGKRRKISIFLLRLIGLYFVAWMPFLVLAFVGNFVQINSWIGWIGAAISHFQGAITCIVVYYTNDGIKHQIRALLCCCDDRKNASEDVGSGSGLEEDPSSRWSHSFGRSFTKPSRSGASATRGDYDVTQEVTEEHPRFSSISGSGKMHPNHAETKARSEKRVLRDSESDSYDSLMFPIRQAVVDPDPDDGEDSRDHVKQNVDIESGGSTRTAER